MRLEPAFPVVGIGASAGGVEALTAFFHAVSADSGMAYVVVTHLGPGRESMLQDILAQVARIPVEHAVDGALLRPNHVYVLATAASLLMEQDRLRVRDLESRQQSPIDVFLASLAQDRTEHAIGVVLSGSGSDGTLGLKAIKERGGLTIAQGSNGSAPQHASMPDTAIAAGTVDLVLPVEHIPARLVGYARGLSALDGSAIPDQPAPEALGLAAVRPAICSVLRSQTGHDFSGYKEPTFLRRLQRRMQVLQVDTAQGYLEHLHRDPKEVVRLFRDLLIGVTSFFRDVVAFEALERTVVPKLFEGRSADAAVRVWIPGCATGEEAFSIAILLRERMDKLGAAPHVQVFATDIDEHALAIARAGRYPAAMLSGAISPERLRRFFSVDGEMRVLTKEVRDLCVFSAHSVVRDPPFSRIDLISCRNLLIYLDGETQRRVMPVFHYALRPGGNLFLGASESIGQFGALFAPAERTKHIFRRRDHPVAVELPLWQPDTPHAPPSAGWGNGERRSLAGLPLRHTVERRLMERFVPAHVVVNREGEVVHYSTRTGKYLEAAVGAPGRHLLAMARRGLRMDLRAALHEASETRHPARREGVEVELDGHLQPVTIIVEPLDQDQADPLFLVLFADQGPLLTPAEVAAQPRGTQEGGEATEQLEHELSEARDRVQALVEQYETGLEEQKATNEELISMNEELQSTNEELQTAKEEQQSVNEELQTVNIDLHNKIEALDLANADLRNLFDSTRIATVFLDRNLVIRSFTPSLAEVFNLIPGDVGRPLTNITCELDYPELRADIEEVLQTGQSRERSVIRQNGLTHHLARVAPYRTKAGGMDGVIATFAEVTGVVRAEAHQRMLVAELNHRVKNTLAVVQGIAAASLERGPARDAFVQRLRALARAHDLLARDGWTSVSFAEIMRAEAAPYFANGRDRFSLSGPDLAVSPRVAQSLGLVIHELATNAMKYGALSAEQGHVEVSWSVTKQKDGPHLHLAWREMGGPPTATPLRRGFGSRVIQREVSAGLGGVSELQFGAEGLRAVIEVPLNARANGAAAIADRR